VDGLAGAAKASVEVRQRAAAPLLIGDAASGWRRFMGVVGAVFLVLTRLFGGLQVLAHGGTDMTTQGCVKIERVLGFFLVMSVGGLCGQFAFVAAGFGLHGLLHRT
jgi:hypothetical protein